MVLIVSATRREARGFRLEFATEVKDSCPALCWRWVWPWSITPFLAAAWFRA
jgi:hypothetical protein